MGPVLFRRHGRGCPLSVLRGVAANPLRQTGGGLLGAEGEQGISPASVPAAHVVFRHAARRRPATTHALEPDHHPFVGGGHRPASHQHRITHPLRHPDVFLLHRVDHHRHCGCRPEPGFGEIFRGPAHQPHPIHGTECGQICVGNRLLHRQHGEHQGGGRGNGVLQILERTLGAQVQCQQQRCQGAGLGFHSAGRRHRTGECAGVGVRGLPDHPRRDDRWYAHGLPRIHGGVSRARERDCERHADYRGDAQSDAHCNRRLSRISTCASSRGTA